MPDKNLRRIRRQFAALERKAPSSRRIIDPLMQKGMRWARVPLALLLIAGGVFSFMPVLGLWMLPLGVLLLAIDIAPLRPMVASAAIRSRRRIGRILRRRRRAAAQR